MSEPVEITPAKESLVYELTYEHLWIDEEGKDHWVKSIKHPSSNHKDHPYINNVIAKAQRGLARNIKLTTIQAKVIGEETIHVY